MTDSKIENKIKSIVNSMNTFDINFDISTIFKSPQLTNLFILSDDLFNLFLNYLITLHKRDIILDLIDYIDKNKSEETNKMLYDFLFYEGLYSLIDIKNLKDAKKINEMLIFNKQPTMDKHFNEIFEEIKNYILLSYSFNDEIYENAKNNEFNFKFLEKYYKKPNFSISIKNTQNLSENLKYDPEFGNAFILPYNYNNEIFKKSFYVLCSYSYDASFENCLKVFLNFEKLFYSKTVSINNEDTNLITFIYFNHPDGYIPNLRYTLDLPKVEPEELTKIKREDYQGFKTTIEKDEKGIYFKTINYDYDKIKNECDELIKNKKYDELLNYIFNSQFLSRSTCLFGYYIYFKLTGKIPNKIKYYDIIALTHSKEETLKEINEGFKYYKFEITTQNLTLQKIIDFVQK